MPSNRVCICVYNNNNISLNDNNINQCMRPIEMGTAYDSCYDLEPYGAYIRMSGALSAIVCVTTGIIAIYTFILLLQRQREVENILHLHTLEARNTEGTFDWSKYDDPTTPNTTTTTGTDDTVVVVGKNSNSNDKDKNKNSTK